MPGPSPQMNLTGSADGRYKFTSKELDAETGLYHLGARSYDAWSGRFFSVDPMASDSTLTPWSPYQYSFDNPIRFKDQQVSGPTGRYSALKWAVGLRTNSAALRIPL